MHGDALRLRQFIFDALAAVEQIISGQFEIIGQESTLFGGGGGGGVEGELTEDCRAPPLFRKHARNKYKK